jgi:hypothetical protein
MCDGREAIFLLLINFVVVVVVVVRCLLLQATPRYAIVRFTRREVRRDVGRDIEVLQEEEQRVPSGQMARREASSSSSSNVPADIRGIGPLGIIALERILAPSSPFAVVIVDSPDRRR